MIKKILIIVVIALIVWFAFHYPKADWQGQLAPQDPSAILGSLPPSWLYKDFVITPRAKYHIKAVVLSKHHYWGVQTEDSLSKYDLALGWGPMSDAQVINQLHIIQWFRWYHYSWKNVPPIALVDIISHSSNHHIIAANQDSLETIKHVKRYDVIEMDGYLVDIQSKKSDWSWRTSVSRFDSGGGACKLFWVTSAFTN